MVGQPRASLSLSVPAFQIRDQSELVTHKTKHKGNEDIYLGVWDSVLLLSTAQDECSQHCQGPLCSVDKGRNLVLSPQNSPAFIHSINVQADANWFSSHLSDNLFSISLDGPFSSYLTLKCLSSSRQPLLISLDVMSRLPFSVHSNGFNYHRCADYSHLYLQLRSFLHALNPYISCPFCLSLGCLTGISISVHSTLNLQFFITSQFFICP